MNFFYLYTLVSIIILPLTNAFDLTWSNTSHIYGTLPSIRAYQQISVSSSNDIYLFGGRYQSNGSNYYKTDIWKWNQQNLNWNTLTQIDTNLISFNGCNMPDINKIDCGFWGINKIQCEERNCCWQEIVPNPNNYAYCYYYNGDIVGTEQPSFWGFTRTNAIINNLVYFIGIDYNGPHNDISDGRIFVFDMNIDKFISHSINPMPMISMYGCTANYNDEIIFYVGGDTSYPNPIKPSLLALNVSSQQWISKTVPPVAYYAQICEIVNHKLYQFGGRDEYSAQDKIFKYDISSDYWIPSSIDSLSQVRDSLRSILTDDKRFVYIIGGRISSSAVSDVIDVFDVNLEAIVDTQQLPSAAATGCLALIDRKILQFGGYYYNGLDTESSDIILISNIITPTPTTYPTTAIPNTYNVTTSTLTYTSNVKPTTDTPITNIPTTSNPTIFNSDAAGALPSDSTIWIAVGLCSFIVIIIISTLSYCRYKKDKKQRRQISQKLTELTNRIKAKK